MYPHSFSTIGKRRNRDENIVQRSYKENGKTKKAHDRNHALYRIAIEIYLTNRLYHSRISHTLFFFLWNIILDSGIQTGIELLNIYFHARAQADILEVRVSAQPGIFRPLTTPSRSYGDDSFRIHGCVFR